MPLFPLAARLRSEPELGGEIVVVLEGSGGAARVVAATRRARSAGLRRGLTLAQARAIIPGLIARGRDAEGERAAQDALLDAAETITPRVEDGLEGIVYLDVCGLERHYPNEIAIAVAAIEAARRAGLPAVGGVATSKLAARVAAEQPEGPHVVPDGSEAAFLAPLPVRCLHPSVELAERLGAWGIRTVGELAALEVREVARRLGVAGRDLHRAATGIDPAPLVPRAPPPSFREGLELEWPLVALEPFQFVARAALDRLVARLEARGLACVRLGLELGLDPMGHDVRTLELPAPTREAKTLLELVRLALESRPPEAPIASFAFVVEPGQAPRAQATLFGPPSPSPEKLATTLARLGARLGPGRVGVPCVVDGHRPERFVMREYAAPPVVEVCAAPPAPRAHGLLAVRVLRPPVALDVSVHDRAGATVPARVVSLHAAQPRVEGEVRVVSGPFRLEEQWWASRPVDREYWDVELADGGLYRIYRDRRAGRWFADGLYD